MDVIETGTESGTIAAGQNSDWWAREEQPPVGWLEIFCLAGLVVLSDLTLFRGGGYTGYGALFFTAPLLLAIGAARRVRRWTWPCLGLLLWGLAGRLLWCGNDLAVVIGAWLVAGYGVSLTGRTPFVVNVGTFLLRALGSIRISLLPYLQKLQALTGLNRLRGKVLSIGVPALAVCVFGAIFVLANPDLLTQVSTEFGRMIRVVREWIAEFSFSAEEVAFLAGATAVSLVLLRPAVPRLISSVPVERSAAEEPQAEISPYYEMARNTLAAVVVLFAVYLVFEFRTLWFRVFEKGFHYSGYAHEGAAWLTVGLGLATLTLSAIFQGAMLREPRIRQLRVWGAVWSLENLVLAVAVYNRLHIYIGFNGMTRMRVIGLLGISAVVVGLVLVLWKISRNRSFSWLIQRQLWVLGLAIYLDAVLPVDGLVMQYNVQRILQGDPAPSVQISVHPISAEGLLTLSPLLQSENETIREGVRAILVEQLDRLESPPVLGQEGWTRFQIADEQLREQLKKLRPGLTADFDQATRERARKAFDEYAYQWF